jgi:hypothetical protein
MATKLKKNLYSLLSAPFRHNANELLSAIEEDNHVLLQEMLTHPFFSITASLKCEALHAAIKSQKLRAVEMLLLHMNPNALEFATRHNNARLVYSLLHNHSLTFSEQEQVDAFFASAISEEPSVLEVFLNCIGSKLSENHKKRALIDAAKANQPLNVEAILGHLSFTSLHQQLREKLLSWAMHRGHQTLIHRMIEELSLLITEHNYHEWVSQILLILEIRPEIVGFVVILINNREFLLNSDLLNFAKMHLSNGTKNGIAHVLSPNNFEKWLEAMDSQISIETRISFLDRVQYLPVIIRHTADIDGMLFIAVSNSFNETVEELLKYPERLSENGLIEAIIEADLNDNTTALTLLAHALQNMPVHVRGNIMLYAINNNRHNIITHVITPCADIPANYIRLARIITEDNTMIEALGELPRFLDDLYEVTDSDIEEARACFQSNAMLLQYTGLDKSSESDMDEDIDDKLEEEISYPSEKRRRHP